MEEVGQALQTYFGQIGMSDVFEVGISGEMGEIVEVIIGDVGAGLGPGAGPPGEYRGGAMFASGSATIQREFLPILGVIGDAIASLPNVHVAIHGHTDNVPYRGSGGLTDNWDLSSARAMSVLRYFVHELRIIEPDRISAVGHSQYRPIADNDTPEGRQQNRRVEIILTQP